ncbi:MAG: hypothetical protein ACPG0L_04855 [Bacteroidia bacterium]
MPGISNIQDFQSLDLAHNLTFIKDFKGMLKQQIKHFKADDYRKFKKDFERYVILDSKAITEKDVIELSDLLTRTYKYDALFLCKGEVQSDHPIFQEIEYPFFSMSDLIDAIQNIEATNMVEINMPSLIAHCLLHMKGEFLKALAPNFYNQWVKFNQSKSKRINISKGSEPVDSKTYTDKWIFSVYDAEDVMGANNMLLKEQVRLNSTRKQSLQLPKFSEILNTTPIGLRPKSKKKVVYESMVSLIRILSPSFSIMTFEQWCESNDDDDHESYLREYLSKRVRQFDQHQVLMKR